MSTKYLWPIALLLAACGESSGPETNAEPAGDTVGNESSGASGRASADPVDGAGPGPDPFGERAERAAARIDGELIRDVVIELADDRYAGRGPGTNGDVMARDYLVRQLEALGFEPGASDRSWQQPFELVGINASQPSTWRFARASEPAGDDALELSQGTEFIAASGVQSERAALADAELVFVGYGIEAPEYGWDDFKGADLTGKVLVMLNNDPDWDPELFAGRERLYYGRWSYKYESAALQEAAGAIIIHTTPSAGYPWQVVQSSWTGEQFELPAGDEPRLQVEAWITDAAARQLMQLAEQDLDSLVDRAKRRDFEPVPLGLTTSITLPNTLSRTQSANVIGVLPGGDAELTDEFVVYTAHHDHLGIGAPNPTGDASDRIYNGARDNATGVGMVLAIGDAFAALSERPRRSLMLLFVGAEEQGLLGSEYFAAHPTVPPGKIAANVNYDSGNIWGRTRDITFVGLGKSSLDAVAARVAAYQNRVLKGDEFPDRGHYYRSDQFNFAKVGVPAFYFNSGTDFLDKPEGWGREQIDAYTDRDYHQPSDEFDDSWSFDGMVQDAQFGFWAGLIVANEPQLPAWNPGDEFEGARRQALDAARASGP
jgi:Zn-dependent M28 family amino/carboxypeptidase